MLGTFNDITPRTDKQGPGPDNPHKRARDLGGGGCGAISNGSVET
jgi:hypothetical protein